MNVRDSSSQKYYSDRVKKSGYSFDDFLFQIGKTYQDKPIDKIEFNIIIKSIVDTLKLKKSDIVFDLGCGNGLITNEISQFCGQIFGFDLNNDLLNIANKFHANSNTTYINSDILNIDFNFISIKQKKDIKLYMYAILQYIEYKNFRFFIKNLDSKLNHFKLFIGDIPNITKQLNFYHTYSRREFLFKEIIENQSVHIGNWWYSEHIIFIANEFGLKATVIEQNPNLTTAHYRFDILIEK